VAFETADPAAGVFKSNVSHLFLVAALRREGAPGFTKLHRAGLTVTSWSRAYQTWGAAFDKDPFEARCDLVRSTPTLTSVVAEA
jgi:hypothetical protein